MITQQLQADQLAVEMAAQLFSLAPHHDAKLYYTTMVQDEARHTEAWLKLVELAGGPGERDPYLDKMARLVIDADTLEEKVFLMQVFFERLIIPKFRMIAKSSPGTVLENLCNRLAIDDGIHHGAGVAYERVLLADGEQEDEGQARQGGERPAPRLRRARALATARARLDRECDADGRHRPPPQRGRPRRAPRAARRSGSTSVDASLRESGPVLGSCAGGYFCLRHRRAARPFGNSMCCGAIRGLPRSSWIWASLVSGIALGLPVQTLPL